METVDEVAPIARELLLTTLYHLEMLRREGKVEAPEFLTDKGLAQAKSLIDHGFKATEEEIYATMAFIMSKGRVAETVKATPDE